MHPKDIGLISHYQGLACVLPLYSWNVVGSGRINQASQTLELTQEII
jgi:hypothetical protein